jgi:hypothetical protein
MNSFYLTDEETVRDFKKGYILGILSILYSLVRIAISLIFVIILNLIFYTFNKKNTHTHTKIKAFPGIILNAPIGLTLRYKAEKARAKEA